MFKTIINNIKLKAQNFFGSDSVKLGLAKIRNFMPIVWEILYFIGMILLILIVFLIILFIFYLILRYFGYDINWKAFRHLKRR